MSAIKAILEREARESEIRSRVKAARKATDENGSAPKQKANRPTKVSRSDFRATYIPSPEEIAAKCEEIRRGWSPRELQSRAVDQRRANFHWEVPEETLVDTVE